MSGNSLQNSRFSGTFPTWPDIRPRGETAAKRRDSRREIWALRTCFGILDPYRRMRTDHSIDLSFCFAGKDPLEKGLGVGLRLRGRPRLEQVEINGSPAVYDITTDNCSTHLFIDIETIETEFFNEIHVEFS